VNSTPQLSQGIVVVGHWPAAPIDRVLALNPCPSWRLHPFRLLTPTVLALRLFFNVNAVNHWIKNALHTAIISTWRGFVQERGGALNT